MPPQPNRFIPPSTPHPLSVRTPIHRIHLILMPGEIRRNLPRPDIPALERCILAPAHQHARIRAPSRHVHGRDMASERKHKLPVASAPQLYAIVEAGRGYPQPVGRKTHMVYLFLVTVHFSDGLCGCGSERVPEHQDVVIGGAA